MKENDADSWVPVQAWALAQRRAGRSVLFVHHAGKSGLQRGTSRKEDVLDTVIALRPVFLHKVTRRSSLAVDLKVCRTLLNTERFLKDEAPGLPANATDLEFYEDCFPKLSACLDRRPKLPISEAA